MSETNVRQISPPLVALASWVVPGLGYVVIGQRTRGLIVGITILLTFFMGILIGGIRVIDVPGYDVDGAKRQANGEWRLKAEPVAEILNKPWYITQAMTGPINILATWGSLKAADHHYRAATARIFDIGTLYTAVAGMLNLLVIIDVTYRAAYPGEPADENAGEEPKEGAAV